MSQQPPEPEWVTRRRNPNARLSGRTWALIIVSPLLVFAAIMLVNDIMQADDAAASIEGIIVGTITLVVGLAIYLLPSYIATKRDVRQKSAVVVINLLAGWTFIGWVVALAMAFAAVDRPETPLS